MITRLAGWFFSSLVLLFLSTNLHAQEDQIDFDELKRSALNVFLDCRRCDRDYIRTEIPFVNFVRDRKEADVHLLITTQNTGGGGREYTIAFIGQRDYADLNYTLIYASNKTNTADEVREGLVNKLKLGLTSSVARTPISDQISIAFNRKIKPTSVADKWNFWVFSTSIRGRLNGEAQRSSKSIDGNFSANRVTLASKLRLGLSLDYDVNVAPAIEYNVFPYSESTRRQLRFLYKIGYNFARYNEETVYGKFSDNLAVQSLEASFEMREPWGTLEASLEGSHYFHDFSKNRIELDLEVSLRIFKGLSLDIEARYERIHDQLALPKGEATLVEILLRRKELANDYQYSLEMGLSFTFGSIYSNVVNPRFGSTGGGRGRRRRF